MADPFVAEIRIFPFTFAPRGWAFCEGQLLPISQNTALFALLGTTYGGDGRSTFGLPNLSGRIPVHSGQGPSLSLRDLGESGGQAAVALLESELPMHNHTARALNDVGDATSPTGAAWATPRVGRASEPSYAAPGTATTGVSPGVVPTGNSAPHNNMPPYLAVRYCIALQGIFPPRP